MPMRAVVVRIFRYVFGDLSPEARGLMICLDDFEPRCLLEAPICRSTAVRDYRAVLVEELLPRFLLAAFDRDFGAAKDDAAGGSTATASISRSAPSRANPEIAIVVLAGLLRSGK